MSGVVVSGFLTHGDCDLDLRPPPGGPNDSVGRGAVALWAVGSFKCVLVASGPLP